MVINFFGDASFSIKTKLSEIVTGKEARVGNVTLSGPGEYEVADIQVVGYNGAYLFSTEDLNLLYVENPSGLPEEATKAIEEDIDVLLLTVDDDPTHIKSLVKMMNDIDPKVAIPSVETTEHAFCKEIGGCPAPVGELKINTKDLVEGERKVVVLHARSRARR